LGLGETLPKGAALYTKLHPIPARFAGTWYPMIRERNP